MKGWYLALAAASSALFFEAVRPTMYKPALGGGGGGLGTLN